MQQGTDVYALKGWILSKANTRIPNRTYNVDVHSCMVTSSWLYDGPTLVVHSSNSTAISKGDAWEHAWERVGDGLCKMPTKGFPAGRCLRRLRENGQYPNYYQ